MTENGAQVTVTFDPADTVSILRALGEVCDVETLKRLRDALKAR